MPLYDFECVQCGNVEELYFCLDDMTRHHEAQDLFSCELCDGVLRQVFLKAPGLGGDVGDYCRKRFPYFDEPLDRMFHSKKEKDAYLKANNLRIREPGEKLKGHTKSPLEKKISEKIEILKADTKKELQGKMDEQVRKIIQTRKT